MRHTLEQRVLDVDRLRRRTEVVRGLLWGIAALIVSAFVAGLLDYGIRFRDPGVRILVSLAVASGSVWTFWRLTWPGLVRRESLVSVARGLEGRYPEMRDSLSSSLAFLAQPATDPLAGSPALRRAVIVETATALERFDWTQVIDQRPVRRALHGVLLVAAIVTSICLVDAPGAKQALARLALPWARIEWPRIHRLQVRPSPQRIALGSDLEFEVTDMAGALPDRVVLEIQWQEGMGVGPRLESIVMKRWGDAAVHRLVHVTQSFQFRVFGGDDDSMDWESVQVLPPPQLKQVRMIVEPPAYSGWPEEISIGPNVRVLAGSQLSVSGVASEPLQATRIRSDVLPEDESLRELVLNISSNGKEFTLDNRAGPPWIANRSQVFTFELEDTNGLVSRAEPKWNIRVIPDQPPDVVLNWDGVPSHVTATARIPLRLVVKDDLRICDVSVELSRSDLPGVASSEVIFVSDPPGASSSGPLVEVDTRTIEYLVDLARLPNLAPGTQVEFRVSATDFKPQASQTPVRRLLIISMEELDERLGQEQSQILGQLAEALREQIDCRSRTRLLQIASEEAGTLSKSDGESLQIAELSQRHVGRLLGDDAPGALAQLDRLMRELKINGIESGDVLGRLRQVQERVSRIHREPVASAQRELSAALRSGRTATDGAAKQQLADSMAAAIREQDDAIQALEELLGQYTRWDNYRRFARDIGRLRRDQEELRDATAEQLQTGLTQELPQAGTPERIQQQRLAERQSDLALRLEKLQKRMTEMASELRDKDPRAGETLSSGVAAISRLALVGQMRESARSVDQRRWGNAVEQQFDVLSGLSQLLEILSDREDGDLAKRTAGLESAAGQLGEIVARQRELRERLDALADPMRRDDDATRRELDRLGSEQEQVASQAARVAQTLDRTHQVPGAAEDAGQAARHAQDAANAARGSDAERARDAARSAEQKLVDAQRQLEQQLQQAKEQLAALQLQALEQALRGLLTRQEAVRDELARGMLDDPSPDRNPEDRDGDRRRLGENQRVLATETESLGESQRSHPAFYAALLAIARDMHRVAQDVLRGDPNRNAKRGADRLVRQLTALLAALQPSSDDPPMNGDQPPQPPPNSDPPAPMPPNQDSKNALGLAELKVVQWMQEELQERTAGLELERQRKGKWTADQQSEVESLAQDQEQLLNIIQNLMK